MWSAPVGDGANRRRTLISRSSLGRYSGRAVTVTTRRDRREKQKRAPGRRRSGGGGGGRMNPLVVGGVVAVAFLLLVLGPRQAGGLQPPTAPPAHPAPGQALRPPQAHPG